MNDTNQSPESIVEKLNQALLELSSKEHEDSLQTVNFHAKKGESLHGRGITWSGKGSTKQFIFSEPNNFWSSENIDLKAEKSYRIGGSPVLNQNSLGSTVTKSNLKELGRLTGLIVDGSVSVAQHLYYDAKNNSLGLGNERPESIIDIVKNQTNLIIDVKEKIAKVGTKSYDDLTLVTSNVARITIGKEGHIQLGNKKESPVSVGIHGKLSIKVEHPDPDVDLHVNGPVKLHGKLHAYSDSVPSNGVFQQGDIYWNSNPIPGKSVGWICVKSGSPGAWASFGMISHLG
jgi:hypothetical protein